jgi:hypothetical protein
MTAVSQVCRSCTAVCHLHGDRLTGYTAAIYQKAQGFMLHLKADAPHGMASAEQQQLRQKRLMRC